MNKEQFLEMLQSQQASGLSIKAYCQTNGISVSNFTNWKRKYVLKASNPSRQGAFFAQKILSSADIP
jgi:hypothetical protein